MFNPLSYFYTLQSYVSSYTHFVRGPVLWSLVWAIALGVVAWFYGPSLAFGEFRPLETAFARLCLIGLVAAGWLSYIGYVLIKRRRAEKAMAEDVTALAEGEAHARPGAAAEARELQGRLRDALKTMRRVSSNGRSYVYDMPWYMVIGAPGTGKSTALVNSGLKFPVMSEEAEDIFVRGVGGTRHCDWWFAEEAILIDSAGRYTTQEGDGAADREGWQAFLAMLKKHRPLQPINGAIVTVSVECLRSGNARDRLREARTIRRRINELNEAFNLQVPVYLMTTKMDTVPGFADFFDVYDQYDREQVWGMTFPLDALVDGNAVSDLFSTEYDLLLERLNGLVLERLQQEPDRDRRGTIFNFPSEVAYMKAALAELVGEICLTAKGQKPPRFRGIYFASATQEGADFDAVRNRVASNELVQPKADNDNEAKSYFIARLLREVVFKEAALVNMDPAAFRRRRRFQQASIALAATLLIGVFGAWSYAYLANTKAMAETERRLAEYDELGRSVATQNVADADFRSVVPALNRLETAPDGFAEHQPYEVASLGLNQEPKIRSQSTVLYRKALNRYLLPRVAVYLQDRIEERKADPAQLFPTLKVYSMLGSLGPMDATFAEQWMAAEFAAGFPGEAQAALREDLKRHFANLVSGTIEPLTLNDVVIDEGREVLRKQPFVEQVLHSVTQDIAARSLPAWRFSDHVSAAGQAVLKRASGEPLSDGIPGVYTRDGYRDVVLPALETLNRRYEENAWVYGGQAPEVPADLSEQVMQLYRQEFEATWRTYIGDLQIRDFRDLSDAASALSILAEADNPLRTLATAIAEATDLRPESERNIAVASAEAGTPAALPAVAVDAQAHEQQRLPSPYADLRPFVAKDKDGRSPYGDVNALVGQVYTQVSRAASASAEAKEIFAIDGSLNESVQNLLAESRRMPAPVGGWMANLGAGISLISADGARENVSALWKNRGLPVCVNAIASRYPFDRQSQTDVALNDFIQLFAPDGVFDGFFKENLASLVDTTTTPWSWRSASGGKPIASDALAQFERAAEIRDTFFGLGSQTPNITIDVTPTDLDGRSTSVVFDVAGTDITYSHGPRRSYSASWPGEEGDRRVRIAFQPPRPGTALTKTGPWALFRMIDAGEVTPVDKSSFQLAVGTGGRRATYMVETGTVRSPFTLEAIRSFACPELL